jgi:hypothetical protein
MIFPGRMLASQGGFTIWQKHQGPGFELHLVNRGIVIDLSDEELAALAEVANEAGRSAGTAEEIKDRARRLQILQARVNDYLRRERGE